MSAIKAAVADCVMTFLWVFCASTLGAGTTIIAALLGLSEAVLPIATLAITTSLIFVLVLVFDVIGYVLGGATFNPTATAAFYAAGVGSDDLLSMALRFPAQAAGAVGGAVAIMEVMPAEYKHMLMGPALKVDLHTGAMAEGVLTFGITFVVLLIILKGPASSFFRTLMLAISTILVIVAGASFTGPSLNPANAFGWAYVNNWHNTWEQFYVFWICPFIGAILAAWVFRAIFPPLPPVNKQKKA